MHLVRTLCSLLFLAFSLLLLGCARDEIKTVIVPKPSLFPFTFNLPEGWKETGPRVEEKGPIRVEIITAFRLKDGEKMDELTVTALPGGGDKAAHINRWRAQVGLGPTKDAPKSEPITVGGSKGDYYDIEGPKQRTLIAVVPGGKLTWYFKLLAAKDIAAQNEQAFKAFLKSLKYKEADDE